MNRTKNILWRSYIAQNILIELWERADYSVRLARRLNITYSNIVKIRNCLEKERLIKVYKKNGRTKLIELTNRGKLVAFKLIELNKILNGK